MRDTYMYMLKRNEFVQPNAVVHDILRSAVYISKSVSGLHFKAMNALQKNPCLERK